jgi:hypothetical protein
MTEIMPIISTLASVSILPGCKIHCYCSDITHVDRLHFLVYHNLGFARDLDKSNYIPRIKQTQPAATTPFLTKCNQNIPPSTTMSDIFATHSANLTGVWKLTSFHQYSTSTPKTLLAKPHGDKPLGRVVIASSGYLTAQVANYESDNASGELVLRGASSYCGPLQLFEDERGLYWQTSVELSSNMDRLGGVQERRAKYWEEGGRVLMQLEPVGDMTTEV